MSTGGLARTGLGNSEIFGGGGATLGEKLLLLCLSPGVPSPVTSENLRPVGGVRRRRRMINKAATAATAAAETPIPIPAFAPEVRVDFGWRPYFRVKI